MPMKWHITPKPNIPAELLAWAQNPLLARLLAQRGIFTVEAARAFTDPAAYRPAPAADLPDMDAAVSLLLDAIAAQTPILVWGDFDVDGQTSTALLVSVLRKLGANVRFHVPHRLTEGHGIRPENLAEELRAGAKLIITCDTGIAAHHAVEAVHAAGAKIIITDHHDLPDTLPPAEAVINPKRLPADHPLRELPGVGVA
ncbi:MAG TPA: single-stranded-DNA-specific exonuclease RecJ, partial [Anaerolineae bacterium]|nr:single-stranded-DNA-specific exonuclease RecJ [Anaerolineae bacterium]